MLEIVIGSGDNDLEVASFLPAVQGNTRVDRLAPENTFDEGGRRRVGTSIVTGGDNRVSLIV